MVRTMKRGQCGSHLILFTTLSLTTILTLSSMNITALSGFESQNDGLNTVADGREGGSVSRYEVEIIETIPHDDEAFTQGLLMHDGSLYESTGLYNGSSLRRVELNGVVNSIQNLSGEEFGEGLAEADGTLIQLTWKSGVAYLYNATTLEKTGNFSYQGEGWGLCNSVEGLVMSNGSSQLSIRNHTDFTIERVVNVTLNGTSLSELNELECVGDYVWANIWHEDWVAIIDRQTGEVTGVVDCSNLFPNPPSGGVLNGIAYDEERQTFWMTGKKWPIMHQVRVVESSGSDDDGGAVDVPNRPDSGDGHAATTVEMVFLRAISVACAVLTLLILGNGSLVGAKSREVHNPSGDTE